MKYSIKLASIEWEYSSDSRNKFLNLNITFKLKTMNKMHNFFNGTSDINDLNLKHSEKNSFHLYV